MTYKEKEINSSMKKMYIFKNFIGFLEIYGQETFGCGYEVDWNKVHRIIIDNDIFDFNNDLENIIYNDEKYDSEEFRDKCYKYIEDQILNDLPAWRLFKLSDHLTKVMERDEYDKMIETEKKLFKQTKCFSCKHYKEYIHFYDTNGRDNDARKVKKENENYDMRNFNLIHECRCEKRIALTKEWENNNRHSSSCFESRLVNKYFKSLNGPKSFYYLEDYSIGSFRQKFYPLTNKHKCQYYEKDENMNYEEFIKNNYEIFIPVKEDDE